MMADMALPEFPQKISRNDIQQTPHGEGINGEDADTYGYANPLDPTRPVKGTQGRNPALMDRQARPVGTPSDKSRTFVYQEDPNA